MDHRSSVLIVDDDDIDRERLRRALQRSQVDVTVESAHDGREAIDLMQTEPTERIVVLDWSMPRMGGLDFLEAVRSVRALNRTVVFVLTGSTDPDDLAGAFDLNVAGYVVKSGGTEAVDRLAALIRDYVEVSRLPVIPSI